MNIKERRSRFKGEESEDFEGKDERTERTGKGSEMGQGKG